MHFKKCVINRLAILGSNPARLFQIRQRKTLCQKPKKKVYYRQHELDKAMDLVKKPNVVLQLKDIIQSQKNKCILLRDLEKEVGFVHKWNCMSVIEKYPTIFRVAGGSRTPVSLSLTEQAAKVAQEEQEAKMLMEPILVKNLRKLLMLSVDSRVALENIEFIRTELGLPDDFKTSLIPKYPQFFSVKEVNGKDCLHLESWDSSLAVTAREEKLGQGLGPGQGQDQGQDQGGMVIRGRKENRLLISRDGNYSGPHAFRIWYADGFRPNSGFLKFLEKWQKLEFPSPYLNARKFNSRDSRARKRVVALLHELLSLTISKRMTSAQMQVFNYELYLPARLLFCLIKHHGIFYITNRGVKSTVFLKEAYDGSKLIEKCPILRFNDKFMALASRKFESPDQF